MVNWSFEGVFDRAIYSQEAWPACRKERVGIIIYEQRKRNPLLTVTLDITTLICDLLSRTTKHWARYSLVLPRK